MWAYRTSLGLSKEIDHFMKNFMCEYMILMSFCDHKMIPEASSLMNEFSGEGELQTLCRRMSVSELLRQAWLDPVKTLNRILNFYGLTISYDLVRTVAVTKKYDGYIKRSENQVEKLKKMDGMKINWRDIAGSPNISFECRQRIMRIMPETFGQLKLIDGIRPATLAVVAAKAL
jgi:tRNA uridine 5-carboxymethylaminomethyl modification enzyme